MVSPKTILWEVDVQADFMLPGGRLYIPGAEKIVANINRMVEAARQGRILLISSADAHNPDDPELCDWPPHCLKGTTGAALLPEARASPRLVIPNSDSLVVPEDLGAYQQITLEKNTLDVFDNPHTDALLERLCPMSSATLESIPPIHCLRRSNRVLRPTYRRRPAPPRPLRRHRHRRGSLR